VIVSNTLKVNSLHANPLAQSAGQVKLDSDKWICFSKFGFQASRKKNEGKDWVKEILKLYLIEQKIYPNHQDEW
jgi:hypothetical protein